MSFEIGFHLAFGTTRARANGNNNQNQPPPDAPPEAAAPPPQPQPGPNPGPNPNPNPAPGPCSPAIVPDAESEIESAAVSSNHRMPKVDAGAVESGQDQNQDVAILGPVEAEPASSGGGGVPGQINLDDAPEKTVSLDQVELPGQNSGLSLMASLEQAVGAGAGEMKLDHEGEKAMPLFASKPSPIIPDAVQSVEAGPSDRPGILRRFFRLGAQKPQEPLPVPVPETSGGTVSKRSATEAFSLSSESGLKKSKSDEMELFSAGSALDVHTTDSTADASSSPPDENRKFVCSDPLMQTFPSSDQVNQQIVSAGNYTVEDLVVEHVVHGKVRFMGLLDLRCFGEVIDISKQVLFQHSGMTLKVPKPREIPPNSLQLTYYNITRAHFAEAVSLNREISDQELEDILEDLKLMNEAHYQKYYPEEKKWMLLVDEPKARASKNGSRAGYGN